jgi:hypothetical protein
MDQSRDSKRIRSGGGVIFMLHQEVLLWLLGMMLMGIDWLG